MTVMACPVGDGSEGRRLALRGFMCRNERHQKPQGDTYWWLEPTVDMTYMPFDVIAFYTSID